MNLLILLHLDHPSEVPEKLIQDRFRKLSCFPEAFSSIHYKGTRTYNPPTDFSGLRRAVEQQLENNTTRSPRQPGVIYKALKVSEEELSQCLFVPLLLLTQLWLIKAEHLKQWCRLACKSSMRMVILSNSRGGWDFIFFLLQNKHFSKDHGRSRKVKEPSWTRS